MPKWPIAVMLLLASPLVLGGAPKLTNMDAAGLLAYHTELAEALDTRAYSHISARDRQEIDRAQSLIRERLAGHSSLDELTEPDRVDVFNAHEQIVAIVEEAADEQLVCTRRKVTGTHRVSVECETAGKLDRSRRALATEEVYRHDLNRPPPDGG